MCNCTNKVATLWVMGACFFLGGTLSGMGGLLLDAASELGAMPGEAGASGIGSAAIMCFLSAIGFVVLGSAASSFYTNTYEKKSQDEAVSGAVSPV